MRSPAGLDDSDDRDEETPLLRAQSHNATLRQTPLPTTQISLLVLPWITESIALCSISPYINQLVRDIPIVGGDERKVGYYTGLIVSFHYATEAVTVLYWNRLSDHIGRKPVLLCCLAGTTASVVLFGLSRSFWTIVFSRCLHGAMKGNIGVVKSAMIELTDETNIARGFSLLEMAWAVGYMIGPLVGGTLSRPQDRWPHLFSQQIWSEYPYFLPCLVVAIYGSISWVIAAMFLKETMTFTPRPARTNLDISQGESSDSLRKDTQKPPPLRSVLTKPVLLSIANYAMLALLEVAIMALIPLVWSTSVEFGGLDFEPALIGLWMSVYGCMNGLFLFTVFPRVIGRFGLRRVLITCITFYAVVVIMFPLENLVLLHATGGSTMAVWPLIFLQLLSLSVFMMGYCAGLMYISSASPSKRSLGAVNGFARVVASVQCAVGPAAADSLFAFSVTNNVLGGNFVYVVLLTLVCIGLYIAVRLPRNMWTHTAS